MRPVLAFAALLLLAAAPAAAQSSDTTRAGAALARACPGARVRLYPETGAPVQGQCGPVMDGRLLVVDGTGEREVRLSGVREVWVRERQTGRGALMGAGVGAGTLSLLGVLLVNTVCYSSECSGDYLAALGYGTLIGGSTGALVGAGIGYLNRGWERRVP